jgi:uncharacterized membrane protein
MRLPFKPLTTTLIGGVVLLLPVAVALAVVGQALALVGQAAKPLLALLPDKSVGGVALATLATLLLLLMICYAAGLLARAALGRRLSETFEGKLHALYPRYTVFKGMTQSMFGHQSGAPSKVVQVSFDDQQMLALEVERLPDGRVVVFLPGAPDPWSGSVVLVDPARVAALAVELAALQRALKGLGHGTAALLGRAA